MTINVFGGGNSGGPAFPVQRSVRLRSSASAYFSRTQTNVATSVQKYTISLWVKRGILGVSQFIWGTPTNYEFARFDSGDTLTISNPSGTPYWTTTQLFRDTSAWYHIVMAFDTTQATASNRLHVYVNGVEITSWSSNPAITQNSTSVKWNVNGQTNYIGQSNSSGYADLYLAEFNSIDGQQLTPSSFGSYNSVTGVWQPIKYSGTYGTNGFYLNFNDNSAATAAAIGKDSSGNGNNWTPNNISVTAGVTYDSMLDVPTLTSSTNANFATLNPLDKDSGNTVVDGNLKVTTSTTGQGFQRATMFVNSGKWYWEILVSDNTGNSAIGIAGQNTIANTTNYVGATADSYCYFASNGNKSNNGASTAYGATYTTNDLIGVALDMDSGTLTFYKNNASQGTAYTGLSGLFAPAVSDVSNTLASIFNINFGQRPFSYTPPSGFKSLNTYNLPTPTIPNGATQFAVSLWSGNNSTQSITNTVNSKSFQPDLVWLKQRSPTGTGHILEDSVRGALQYLGSESTAAESTIAGTVTAFNSNGFSIGSQAGTNATGSTYVGWQWKASNAAAVTNTSGSITSSVSANAGAGFSIVTYTGTASAGATVGHGLNIKPSLIIVKQRTTASTTGWAVYHSALDSGDSTNSAYILLNSANGKSDVTTGDAETVFGNGTVWKSPTSSVFTIGANGIVNASSGTYVAYCFSEIAGYSKFGSYTGNGAADGPFVYCGFRPRFIMYKRSDSTGDWTIIDSSRSTYNVQNDELYPNSNIAESAAGAPRLDSLSNGFKIRNAGGAAINASGGTYIFMAVAESPFNYSLAR